MHGNNPGIGIEKLGKRVYFNPGFGFTPQWVELPNKSGAALPNSDQIHIWTNAKCYNGTGEHWGLNGSYKNWLGNSTVIKPGDSVKDIAIFYKLKGQDRQKIYCQDI